MEQSKKIISKYDPNIILRVIPGHFATANSHVNYYMDITPMKTRQNEAERVAHALSQFFIASTVVDTILCIDGCEVIGAYLANHLTESGITSINQHKTMYITSAETTNGGQFIFRENMVHMIKDKNVMLLLSSATTGKTVANAIHSISYYGGNISGVSAIFSAASKVFDYPIHALFSTADLPDYKNYEVSDCIMCKEKKPIDAIVNGFGYARV